MGVEGQTMSSAVAIARHGRRVLIIVENLPCPFDRRVWQEAMTNQSAPPKDAKSGLQEYLLARGAALPEYRIVSREGPPHNPVFVIAAHGLGQSATGTAGSKQMAERLAAAALLAQLQQDTPS